MVTLLAAGATFGFTTLLTIAGVGAAFILIPIFLALGVELHTAMATALLLNAIAMAAASLRFVRAGLVVWRMALPLAVSAVVLSPVGAWVSQGLDRELLLWLFVGFLVFAAAMMLFYEPKGTDVARHQALWLPVGLAVGSAAGFVGGLLGVGGGNLIVPALVVLGFDPKRASATSALVVVFSSLAGSAGHLSMTGLDLPLLGLTALAAILGAALGSWLLTSRLSGRRVKQVIGVVLLGIALQMGWGLLA